MRELRHRPAESSIDSNLFWSVGKMVVAPDHVRNLHQRIVDGDHIVVDRHARGANQDRIGNCIRSKLDCTANNIVKRDWIGSNRQTYCKWLARGGSRCACIRRDVSTATGVDLWQM